MSEEQTPQAPPADEKQGLTDKDVADRLVARLEVELDVMDDTGRSPEERRFAGTAAAGIMDTLLKIRAEHRAMRALRDAQERHAAQVAETRRLQAACDHRWVITPKGAVCQKCGATPPPEEKPE
jgi:hypothetical protein